MCEVHAGVCEVHTGVLACVKFMRACVKFMRERVKSRRERVKSRRGVEFIRGMGNSCGTVRISIGGRAAMCLRGKKREQPYRAGRAKIVTLEN